jgi:hypothetical protein
LISDPEVQKLFHDFIPRMSVPTRQKLSTMILTHEISKIHAEVKNTSKGAYATIQCDGWKDISKKHLVVFLYTANHEASNCHINRVRSQLIQTILRPILHMSALQKTGINLLKKMEDEWAYLENELGLEPIGACGDASGDEWKMRNELLKLKPYALIAGVIRYDIFVFKRHVSNWFPGTTHAQ